jgi:hypothetical protein
LAVVGHADLAWSYSFQDVRSAGRNRPSRFQGLLRTLVEGRRAGVGLGALLHFFNEANAELTTLYEGEEAARVEGRSNPVDPTERAHLWMLRQDLAGYILLGDPAVRLPLASTEAALSRSLPTLPAQPLMPDASAPRSAEGMATAVLRLLGGQESARDIASWAHVPVEELHHWRRVYMEAGLKALAELRPSG